MTEFRAVAWFTNNEDRNKNYAVVTIIWAYNDATAFEVVRKLYPQAQSYQIGRSV